MATTVYHYQIYCETEQAWKYTWGTEGEAPTTCPTNTAHTVNLSSVAKIGSVSENDVVVHQPTEGYFMCESVPMVVPACNPGDVVPIDVPFDDTILLWTTGFNAKAEMVDDCFSVVINPDTVVGGLTATGNVNDTVLNVTSTVTDNVTPGMYLKLMDNDSPPNIQDVGKILAVDGTAGTVTVKNALTETFSPGTIVMLNLYMAKDIFVDIAGHFVFGEKGFQGKRIPAGTVFRMLYTNHDGLAKTFHWKIGFYYGSDFV
jgi:hypothetical protein